MARKPSLRLRLARLIAGADLASLTMSAPVDDSAGWLRIGGGPHDRDHAELQKLYADALDVWRHHPFAKRAVEVVSDFVIGDGFTISAPGQMGTFLERWWNHPKNLMDLRLPDWSDELVRAGDLFPTLSRNPQDGMSYVRAIPKDLISKIITAENDWETELGYVQEPLDLKLEQRTWKSPAAPDAKDQKSLMLHFAVNRPVGATMGESDMASALPWFRKYSRMLDDRVRLHWAVRAFLWMVTVPANKVQDKAAQYATKPDPGTVIVKDPNEEWQAITPELRAADAQHDLRAVRHMTDAGTAMAPHWRGEGESLNLATAKAMQDPLVRHLARRQRYLRYATLELAHTAYSRAWEIGKVRKKPDRTLIEVTVPDISREENQRLASAATQIATAMSTLQDILVAAAGKPTLQEFVLRMICTFAGEGYNETMVQRIIAEVAESRDE